jgi:hypothetical protein
LARLKRRLVIRLFGLGQYRNDWAQAEPLAQAIADNISPKLSQVGFIVPMPVSSQRARKPVTEVANKLGVTLNIPALGNALIKAKTGKSLKDLNTKVAACANCPRLASTMSVCAAKLIKFWSLIAGFFACFF